MNSVAFSPDGTRIASGSRRQHGAGVGRRHRPAHRPAADRPHDAVYSVAFSPDGTRIASGSADKTVRVWDAATGQPIGAAADRPHRRGVQRGVQPRRQAHRLRQRRQHRAGVGRRHRPARRPAADRPHGQVYSVAFSPDGTASPPAATTTRCGCGTPATGQPIGAAARPATPSACVFSVAFSPDGKRIVSGSADNTCGCGTRRPANPSAAAHRPHGRVSSVAFSPDGMRIVSGSADNTCGCGTRAPANPSAQPIPGTPTA